LTYTPTWEPIAEALERVVATGLPKGDAQRNLCRAIADLRIDIRLHLAATQALPALTLSRPSLEIPARLSPSDIDWKFSRLPKESSLWPGPSQRFGEPTTLYIRDNFGRMNRTVESVEVRVADVIRVFCDDDDVTKPEAPKPAEEQPKQAPKRSPQVESALLAIDELWPVEIPPGLKATDRDKQINDLLKTKKLSQVSKSSILRALSARSGRPKRAN
jgi:hypothetical protein